MTSAQIHVSRSPGARQGAALRFAGCVGLTACLLGAIGGVPALQAATPKPGSQSRIVDPAVVPAGAMMCTNCGPACGGHHGRGGHHHGCRDGQCVPYCPVRPDRYGFYGTQWRKWPGQQVVQVSNNQDAAPVAPPRSEVPGAEEESISPQADDLPAPAPQAAAPMTEPAPDLLPSRPETEPTPEPRMPEPAPAPAPEVKPAPAPTPAPAVEPEPTPAPAPAQPRPQDENLFEAESGWRAKRKFAVTSRDAEVKPAGHVAGSPLKLVPRVPFDAKAEARQVRAAGGR